MILRFHLKASSTTLYRIRDGFCDSNGCPKFSREQLLIVYMTRVRSILDYCSPVYCGLLNAAQSDKLESVQRLSVAVIMGVGATSYREGLVALGLPL